MPPRVVLDIPQSPVPKGRPQVSWRGGKKHAFTPDRTALAERRMRDFARAQLGDDWVPFRGPLAVTITVYRVVPRDMPKRVRATAACLLRPDLDNFLKLALDALAAANGVDWCVFLDDSQVVELHATKVLAVDRAPGWVIVIEPLAAEAGE